jgi:hypothetical protein
VSGTPDTEEITASFFFSMLYEKSGLFFPAASVFLIDEHVPQDTVPGEQEMNQEIICQNA